MASNPIRTSKTLPLDTSAWIKAYTPLSNWPAKKWLSFQTLESGSFQDGLVVLHDFQKHLGITDPEMQKDMLVWFKSAAAWDKTSLKSWTEWDHILKATPLWSLPIQSQVLTEHGARFLHVAPEHYGSIANIQDHFGRYWNQVHSRIPAHTDINSRSLKNTNTPWETYNTFRRELTKGELLDHSNNIRWMDFDRLAKTPKDWRKILTPLYHEWLRQLAPTAHIEGTDLQTWLHAFEENGLDASKVALPIFPEAYDYMTWSIPSSWKDASPDEAFEKVRYLDKAASRYINGDEYQEYPAQMLQWINDCCHTHMNAWSLDKRLEASNAFFLSSAQHNYYQFTGSSHLKGTVHDVFLRWLPEYKEQLESVKNSMEVLGLDYLETTTDYMGRTKKEYTANTARQEIVHYTTMLRHVLNPGLVEPSEDVGHLFDSDDDSLLGI